MTSHTLATSHAGFRACASSLTGICNFFFVLCLLAVFPASSPAQDFNFSAYQSTPLTVTVNKWNGITQDYRPGFSVLPPEKHAFTVMATSVPFPCNTQTLTRILAMQRMEQLLQQVPVTHCIKVREKQDAPEFVFHIQDVLVSSYIAEVKTGFPVKLYGIFFAYGVSRDLANNFPFFLIGEFEAL